MQSLPRASHKIENAHSDSIWSIAWSGSERLLTGSLDGSVRIWNSRSLETPLSTTVKEHVGVNAMVATDDGTAAIVCYQNSTLRFYHIDETTAALQESCAAIKSDFFGACTLSMSPDDDIFVTGTQDGKLHLRSLKSNTPKSTEEDVASNSGDMESQQPLSTLNLPDSSHVLSTSFNDDGALIAAATITGTVVIFDPQSTQTPVHITKAHNMPVRCVKFSPDGKLIYTASDDSHVAVYDSRSGKVVNSFSHSGMALTVDASPDGRHFCVGSSDNQVYLWDLGMQRRECVYASHTDQVWSIAYDPTNTMGRRFASAGDDAMIQLYE